MKDEISELISICKKQQDMIAEQNKKIEELQTKLEEKTVQYVPYYPYWYYYSDYPHFVYNTGSSGTSTSYDTYTNATNGYTNSITYTKFPDEKVSYCY